MKVFGNISITKLIELIDLTFAKKTDSITDTEIATAWHNIEISNASNDGYIAGNLTVAGNIYADHVYNAVYNDYAEFFPKGEETEPGDIIVLDLDSDVEHYIKSHADNKIVVGVHTDEYAFLIGGNKAVKLEDNLKHYIPVSLAGRVKVKFTGLAHKGSYVVPSDIPGTACEYIKEKDDPANIFGILVEEDNKDKEIRRLKIKLK